MNLIHPLGVTPMNIVWGDRPYVFDPNYPEELYWIYYYNNEWKMSGISEPYFIVLNRDLPAHNIDMKSYCDTLYSDYKKVCDWTPSLVPGKFAFYYQQIRSIAKQCMKLRAKHLILCRTDQDLEHIHAILRNTDIIEKTYQLQQTARHPNSFQDRIDIMIGINSITDYENGPIPSIGEKLMAIPEHTIRSYIIDSRLNIVTFFHNRYRNINDIPKDVMVYYLLSTNNFQPLFELTAGDTQLTKFM